VPKLKSLPVIVSIIGVALCACSGGTSSPTTKASPTVDSVTQKYLAVVNGFWQDHVIATSDMQPILEALDVISPAVQHV